MYISASAPRALAPLSLAGVIDAPLTGTSPRLCLFFVSLRCVCLLGCPLGCRWSDGKIRAFGPQSGKLLYVINDAHVGGVTAIACANDGEKIISGGFDGSVRVWRITAESRVMLGSMKVSDRTRARTCVCL